MGTYKVTKADGSIVWRSTGSSGTTTANTEKEIKTIISERKKSSGGSSSSSSSSSGITVFNPDKPLTKDERDKLSWDAYKNYARSKNEYERKEGYNRIFSRQVDRQVKRGIITPEQGEFYKTQTQAIYRRDSKGNNQLVDVKIKTKDNKISTQKDSVKIDLMGKAVTDEDKFKQTSSKTKKPTKNDLMFSTLKAIKDDIKEKGKTEKKKEEVFTENTLKGKQSVYSEKEAEKYYQTFQEGFKQLQSIDPEYNKQLDIKNKYAEKILKGQINTKELEENAEKIKKQTETLKKEINTFNNWQNNESNKIQSKLQEVKQAESQINLLDEKTINYYRNKVLEYEGIRHQFQQEQTNKLNELQPKINQTNTLGKKYEQEFKLYNDSVQLIKGKEKLRNEDIERLKTAYEAGNLKINKDYPLATAMERSQNKDDIIQRRLKPLDWTIDKFAGGIGYIAGGNKRKKEQAELGQKIDQKYAALLTAPRYSLLNTNQNLNETLTIPQIVRNQNTLAFQNEKYNQYIRSADFEFDRAKEAAKLGIPNPSNIDQWKQLQSNNPKTFFYQSPIVKKYEEMKDYAEKQGVLLKRQDFATEKEYNEAKEKIEYEWYYDEYAARQSKETRGDFWKKVPTGIKAIEQPTNTNPILYKDFNKYKDLSEELSRQQRAYNTREGLKTLAVFAATFPISYGVGLALQTPKAVGFLAKPVGKALKIGGGLVLGGAAAYEGYGAYKDFQSGLPNRAVSRITKLSAAMAGGYLGFKGSIRKPTIDLGTQVKIKKGITTTTTKYKLQDIFGKTTKGRRIVRIDPNGKGTATYYETTPKGKLISKTTNPIQIKTQITKLKPKPILKIDPKTRKATYQYPKDTYEIKYNMITNNKAGKVMDIVGEGQFVIKSKIPTTQQQLIKTIVKKHGINLKATNKKIVASRRINELIHNKQFKYDAKTLQEIAEIGAKTKTKTYVQGAKKYQIVDRLNLQKWQSQKNQQTLIKEYNLRKDIITSANRPKETLAEFLSRKINTQNKIKADLLKYEKGNPEQILKYINDGKIKYYTFNSKLSPQLVGASKKDFNIKINSVGKNGYANNINNHDSILYKVNAKKSAKIRYNFEQASKQAAEQAALFWKDQSAMGSFGSGGVKDARLKHGSAIGEKPTGTQPDSFYDFTGQGKVKGGYSSKLRTQNQARNFYKGNFAVDNFTGIKAYYGPDRALGGFIPTLNTSGPTYLTGPRELFISKPNQMALYDSIPTPQYLSQPKVSTMAQYESVPISPPEATTLTEPQSSTIESPFTEPSPTPMYDPLTGAPITTPPWLFGSNPALAGGATRGIQRVNRYGRFQDPFYRLTGKSKYGDMNIYLRGRYGNLYS